MPRRNREIIKDIHKLYDELGDVSRIAIVIFALEDYGFTLGDILYMAQRFNAKALEILAKLPSVENLHVGGKPK